MNTYRIVIFLDSGHQRKYNVDPSNFPCFDSGSFQERVERNERIIKELVQMYKKKVAQALANEDINVLDKAYIEATSKLNNLIVTDEDIKAFNCELEQIRIQKSKEENDYYLTGHGDYEQ